MYNSYRSLTKLLVVTGLVTTFLIVPQQVLAQTSDTSARITGNDDSTIATIPLKAEDRRIHILQKFLASHNSPLADYSQTFITEADKNNIDWKLLPAISGVESTFGVNIPAYSYNGWGFGIYGNNTRRFASWNEAIATIAKSLREDYMDKWGAKNVYDIGRTYAADPFWAGKVANFMDQISAVATEDSDQKHTLSISL